MKGQLIVESPELAEIKYVLDNLSPKSREDILPVMDYSTDFLAHYYFEHPMAYQWVFYNAGKPAAFLGSCRSHGDVWSVYGMGTADWKAVWRLVTLVAKRDMMQAVLDAGAHRAHCLSPASHEDTHKWLRYLGATHEAAMPRYGKNGEDYIMFSWLKD